jgi:hypothetical protein
MKQGLILQKDAKLENCSYNLKQEGETSYR